VSYFSYTRRTRTLRIAGLWTINASRGDHDTTSYVGHYSIRSELVFKDLRFG
jgi:hypothetical protein